MNNELIINILMSDGNTRQDAIAWINSKYPEKNVIIYDNYNDYLDAQSDNDYKSLDDIRAHKYTPYIEAVKYNDKEYIVEYIF